MAGVSTGITNNWQDPRYNQYLEWQRNQALLAQQGQTDIQTRATKDISGQSQQAALAAQRQAEEAQAARESQGYTHQQALQSENLRSEEARQHAMEQAQAALQAAGYTAQMGLQKSQLESQAQRQAEAEQAQSGLQLQSQKGESELVAQQAALQQAAEARRALQFQSFFNSLNGDSPSAGYMTPNGGGGGGGGGNLQSPPPGEEDAARAAAFAQAKDQAGLIGRSAISGLQNVMGGRGLTGSGLATNQAGGILHEGATQLGDINREQMNQGFANARQRASEQYQGNLTRRGQNLSLLGSLSGLQSARAY